MTALRSGVASILLLASLGAIAAFPTIFNQPPTESGSATNVTTFTVNLPASIPDGSLCIVNGAGDGSGDYISATEAHLDFDNNVAFPASADSNAGGSWYYSTWSPCGSADSSSNFDLTVTSAETGVFFTSVIQGWDGATPPAYSTVTENASSNSCDVASFTTFSGVDTIVFWYSGRDPQNWTATPPANMASNNYEDTIDEALDTLTMATVTTTASSFDPDSASLSATASNACWAMAVRAPSAGGTSVGPFSGKLDFPFRGKLQ